MLILNGKAFIAIVEAASICWLIPMPVPTCGSFLFGVSASC